MKSFIIAATAVALTSGALLSTAAEASPYGHRLTPAERVIIAKDRARLNALQHRVRADGHVTMWERAKLRAAEAHHKALVYRLTHN